MFSDRFRVNSLDDIVSYIKSASEYKGFTLNVTSNAVTTYRVEIDSGIAAIKECIHVDSNLHVKLSYESVPIPLPTYLSKMSSGKLNSLDLLTNLPSFCRNATCPCDIDVIKKLLRVSFYSPKGRPKFSSDVLRFSLILRYTSHSAYQFISKFLPLPRESLRRILCPRLKSCHCLS